MQGHVGLAPQPTARISQSSKEAVWKLKVLPKIATGMLRIAGWPHLAQVPRLECRWVLPACILLLSTQGTDGQRWVPLIKISGMKIFVVNPWRLVALWLNTEECVVSARSCSAVRRACRGRGKSQACQKGNYWSLHFMIASGWGLEPRTCSIQTFSRVHWYGLIPRKKPECY